MSEAEAIRRCRITNPEVVAYLRDQDRSFIAYGAHYGNWELASLAFPSQLAGIGMMAIFSPFRNKQLEDLFTRNRGRTGTRLVSRRHVLRYYFRDPPSPSVEFFIADQSPSNANWRRLHWTRFLNRTTGFIAGPEYYARRFDRPVYYMALRRESRGHYAATLIKVTDQPTKERAGFVTETFARQLEREIVRDPSCWLWTHRRWKRPVPPEAAAALTGKDYVGPSYDES